MSTAKGDGLLHEVGSDGVHIFTLKATAADASAKPRLDTYLASSVPSVSRSKILTCIKGGLVSINGKGVEKGGYKVRPGEVVVCRIPPPPPVEAVPEAIPLDIVYEDEALLIVNKAAGMVVHPAPGLSSGTLVNALLHHCGLPAMRFLSGNPPLPKSLAGAAGDAADGAGGAMSDMDPSLLDDVEGEGAAELSDGEEPLGGTWTVLQSNGPPPVIRPGIVHRIDRGTTGLLVCSKDDRTHTGLCRQFEERTTKRLYWALTVGVPQQQEGRVETNIDRDPKDFRKMTWTALGGGRGRRAASNYKVLEVLAEGGAALVQWRLETGRTHQIRVHAKYIGHPLLADEAYGGGGGGAAERVARGGGATKRAAAAEVVKELARPALHAKTLGFVHPGTGKELLFNSEPPADFMKALEVLRALK